MGSVIVLSRFWSPLILFTYLISVICAQNNLVRQFEYKHSFRKPILAMRDGSIPFWTLSGDTIPSSGQLRLASSIRSLKGMAWNKRPFVESVDFEVEVEFKITGPGRIGADGLAIWYTATQGTLGPVFGGNDYWTGLAVLLDSYDNDGAKNNPSVSIMVNDGTRSYDHHSDGASQIVSGCQKDFRNKPFPIRLKLQYTNNVIVVSMTDGMSSEQRYELCLRAENIFLPKNGYFGVSAATGGLADDHDVLDFSVYSMKVVQQTGHQISPEERQKYNDQFVQQKKTYEEDHEQFKKEHPEKARDDEEDLVKYYEDATSREWRLVHESNAAISRVIEMINSKSGEIARTQIVHTSMLQQCVGTAGQQQAPAAGGAQPIPQVVGGAFQPHEKNEVLQLLRDLSSSFRDLKNYVNEIFTRTYKMEQTLGSGSATGSGVGLAQESQHVRSSLENIQNEIRQLRAQQQSQANVAGGSCADLSCASSSFLTVIIVIQSAVILAFVYMRSKHDKAKFY